MVWVETGSFSKRTYIDRAYRYSWGTSGCITFFWPQKSLHARYDQLILNLLSEALPEKNQYGAKTSIVYLQSVSKQSDMTERLNWTENVWDEKCKHEKNLPDSRGTCLLSNCIIFQFCLTEYHKCNGLKQQKIVIPHFL